MDTTAPTITIYCKACGSTLATKTNGTLVVRGIALPTEHLDAVVLKCTCKRLRTYYFREDTHAKMDVLANKNGTFSPNRNI